MSRQTDGRHWAYDAPYQTQVIYRRDVDRTARFDGRSFENVLWATTETNEALVIVACIESGRVPIVDIRPYAPWGGPNFDEYDDELVSKTGEQLQSAPPSGQAIVEKVNATLRAIDPNTAVAGTTWSIVSEGSPATYNVTVRPDTVNGGNYAHCTCPSWKYKRGKGEDCKHIVGLRKVGAL